MSRSMRAKGSNARKKNVAVVGKHKLGHKQVQHTDSNEALAKASRDSCESCAYALPVGYVHPGMHRRPSVKNTRLNEFDEAEALFQALNAYRAELTLQPLLWTDALVPKAEGMVGWLLCDAACDVRTVHGAGIYARWDGFDDNEECREEGESTKESKKRKMMQGERKGMSDGMVQGEGARSVAVQADAVVAAVVCRAGGDRGMWSVVVVGGGDVEVSAR